MTHRAFLTPEEQPGSLKMAPLWLFTGDDWEAIPRGVLTEMLYTWNYEALPAALSVEETIEVYQDALAKTFKQWNDPQPYFARAVLLKRQSLIAYWPLWEGGGATLAKDRGPNGFYGTPAGHTWESAGIGDGMTGVALSGTASRIDVGTAGVLAALNIAEGSIGLWVNPVSWKVNPVQFFFAANRPDGTTYVYIYQAGTSGMLLFAVRTNGATYTIIYTPPGALTGYHHLALTMSVGAGKIIAYLDGLPIGNRAHPGAPAFAAQQLNIGAIDNAATYPTAGDFAHVSLWNSALNAKEIAYLATV